MHKEKVAKYLLQKDRTVSCFLLNFHGENIIIGTIQTFTCNVYVYSPSREVVYLLGQWKVLVCSA